MPMQVKECGDNFEAGGHKQVGGGGQPNHGAHDESDEGRAEEKDNEDGGGKARGGQGGGAGAQRGGALQGHVRVDAEQAAFHCAGAGARVRRKSRPQLVQ